MLQHAAAPFVKRFSTRRWKQLPGWVGHPKTLVLVATSLIGGCGVSLLSSCSTQPNKVTLSSGIAGGFYARLGEQVRQAATTTVDLTVQNLESKGSAQNLQRLLDRQVDFALVQLDLAQKPMEQGKIQAVALLSNESVHVIARKDAGFRTFADLQGKRVAIGAPGSGIRFTANQLIQANGLKLQADDSGFDAAFQKLQRRQVEALLYVGSVGASQRLRQQLATTPNVTILPLQPELINHLMAQAPGSYQPATLPLGIYTARPPIPERDVTTLSTATVLVTRPDVSQQTVGLVTWAIVDTARTYSPFYPDLQNGEEATLLRKGLFYIHPAAQTVFEQGDPRAALIRYWENNGDLQAGVFLVGTSSLVGFLFQRWRQARSLKLVTTTTNRINELQTLLAADPEQALRDIEALRQEHRLRFIDGAITSDMYEQLQQKTQTFAEQCRNLLEKQRKQFVMDTLLLLDEWQAMLQTDPATAMQKLSQIKQQYREMLLANQVDLEAYVELMELTLMSVMTLVPQGTHARNNSTPPRRDH
ncbi:TAXI family TRAP transporter solute-binding subunit [Leptolyngbya sp. FACHB-321]|uniref:TAXI family TRAP transporter solute-binding subunit n=1 Tax=Leptolyngbya sp. FACHB-321 TaxID=2692807 RepID=UPI0016836A84|nr:TAXI family TRAP transporter solute-binding subunit [Leptolyngbya sp. FACHB-321]MBD2034138.1 TAXI family TRAP transporter solute-binding subunit [Leptolyngbya sp. FACHB-321]